MFKRIDPTMLPDGLCWSVVETLKTGACQRTRIIWWWEDRQPDGSIKRRPLVPYAAITETK
jgi:hypothetical protein